MSPNILKELRERRGETRREVCMDVGITEYTLLSIETGRTPNPGVKTIKALADHYGVSMDELFDSSPN
jgi:transcriptional regulator with XRE-family HTH domain